MTIEDGMSGLLFRNRLSYCNRTTITVIHILHTCDAQIEYDDHNHKINIGQQRAQQYEVDYYELCVCARRVPNTYIFATFQI